MNTQAEYVPIGLPPEQIQRHDFMRDIRNFRQATLANCQPRVIEINAPECELLPHELEASFERIRIVNQKIEPSGVLREICYGGVFNDHFEEGIVSPLVSSSVVGPLGIHLGEKFSEKPLSYIQVSIGNVAEVAGRYKQVEYQQDYPDPEEDPRKYDAIRIECTADGGSGFVFEMKAGKEKSVGWGFGKPTLKLIGGNAEKYSGRVAIFQDRDGTKFEGKLLASMSSLLTAVMNNKQAKNDSSISITRHVEPRTQ